MPVKTTRIRRRFRSRYRPGPLYHIACMLTESMQNALQRCKTLKDQRQAILRIGHDEEFWTGLDELQRATRKVKKIIDVNLCP